MSFRANKEETYATIECLRREIFATGFEYFGNTYDTCDNNYRNAGSVRGHVF